MAILVYCGGAFADEFAWLDRTVLERHLAGRERAKIPVGDLLPEGHALCAAGSYAAELPRGYRKAAQDLEHAYLLPVREGDGLLFSVNEDRRIESVSVLSVWPDTVTLSVDEPVCIPAISAQLGVARDDGNIVIRLEVRN
ncbi:hypothetical protein PVV74_03695 [Roseovarius sp. SK2]|uniref:hypothetical protein n=1 Tax=Roseovarius TaxID=74030 RepID=UPI00237A528D|nr:hypothetical protein [Roseovarius sp. SK2]MDD9724553.1 hypothetical protein [Roseovarius sp. SK2]